MKKLLLTLLFLVFLTGQSYASINIYSRDYLPVTLHGNFTNETGYNYMPINIVRKEIKNLQIEHPQLKNVTIDVYIVSLKCYLNKTTQIAGVYELNSHAIVIFSDYSEWDLPRVVRHEVGHWYKFNLVDSRYWGSEREEAYADYFALY